MKKLFMVGVMLMASQQVALADAESAGTTIAVVIQAVTNSVAWAITAGYGTGWGLFSN